MRRHGSVNNCAHLSAHRRHVKLHAFEIIYRYLFMIFSGQSVINRYLILTHWQHGHALMGNDHWSRPVSVMGNSLINYRPKLHWDAISRAPTVELPNSISTGVAVVTASLYAEAWDGRRYYFSLMPQLHLFAQLAGQFLFDFCKHISQMNSCPCGNC